VKIGWWKTKTRLVTRSDRTAPIVDTTEERFWLVRYGPIFFFLIAPSIAGLYAGTRVPISVFPETNFPRVVIGVDNGVMPVDQMQVTITKPIEDAVNSVPGLVTVRSTTSRGSAEVSLFFDWNVDMFRILELVDAAIARVRQTLPPDAVITTNRLTFATFPVLGYSLTSDSVPLTKLWELATYDLKPSLNRVDGVSNVVVQGDQIPNVEITPQPSKLFAAGVTVPDVLNAVQNTNVIDSPGLLQTQHKLVLGLIGGQVHDAAQYRLVVKTTPAGAAVRVADVADVQPGVMPVYTTVTADGKQSVLLNITRQPSSNTVAVADSRRRIHNCKDTASWRSPRAHHDQLSSFMRASGVRDAILIGLGSHASSSSSSLVTVFFSSRARYPGHRCHYRLFLWIIGESESHTLGGLAAAVGRRHRRRNRIVENIVLHKIWPVEGEALIALRRDTIPLIGSTVTPVVVFLPLTVTGVTGSFFRALAVTMTAMLTSLLLALTWTPGLSLIRSIHTA
jgi:multidrug efflux pump subunit AcrB